jgi:hypothetical protein
MSDLHFMCLVWCGKCSKGNEIFRRNLSEVWRWIYKFRWYVGLVSEGLLQVWLTSYSLCWYLSRNFPSKSFDRFDKHVTKTIILESFLILWIDECRVKNWNLERNLNLKRSWILERKLNLEQTFFFVPNFNSLLYQIKTISILVNFSKPKLYLCIFWKLLKTCIYAMKYDQCSTWFPFESHLNLPQANRKAELYDTILRNEVEFDLKVWIATIIWLWTENCAS